MNSAQSVIIVFGLIYLIVLAWTRRKTNFEEFSVAGRSLGFFFIFASFSASYIGPGWTLGLTRDGFTNGFYLGLMAVVTGGGLIIVASKLAPIIRRKFPDSYSLGDIVGGKNGHNHAVVRLTTGVINLLLMSIGVVLMSYAGGELINYAFGFSKLVSIGLATSLVTIYSMFGGIRSSILTDTFQFIQFAIIMPIVAILMISSDQFSWSEYTDIVLTKTNFSFDSNSVATMLGIMLLFLLSQNGLDGYSINRFLASKNEHVAKRAGISAGIFMICWVLLMAFIGSMGGYLYSSMPDSDQLLLAIANENLSGFFFGFFIVSMIGMVMSTQDSMLNGAGICFSQDILAVFRPQLSNNAKLISSKIYTLFLGLIAITIASYLDSILHMAMTILEHYIPILVPSVIFSILKRNCRWQSSLVSMAFGALSILLFKYVLLTTIPALFLAFLISCISYLLTDRLLKRPTAIPSK